MPLELLNELLPEGEKVVALPRSLGEHAEADELESEIADVAIWVALLRSGSAPAEPDARERRLAVAARWPSGHLGWVFNGLLEYESGARSFLAEGAARNERLVFVADDPVVDRWPRSMRERGQLLIVSTVEAYGPERMAQPAVLHAGMAAFLAESLRDGYSGFRSVADNTGLIEGEDRLTAWLEWEAVADSFLRDNAITVMCSFDQTRACPHSLRRVMGVHHAV